jgi:hypothetical protein
MTLSKGLTHSGSRDKPPAITQGPGQRLKSLSARPTFAPFAVSLLAGVLEESEHVSCRNPSLREILVTPVWPADMRVAALTSISLSTGSLPSAYSPAEAVVRFRWVPASTVIAPAAAAAEHRNRTLQPNTHSCHPRSDAYAVTRRRRNTSTTPAASSNSAAAPNGATSKPVSARARDSAAVYDR